MTKLFTIYTFLICWNPVIKSTFCAALERNWSNTFMGARRTASSALVDEDDIDDWQPAVQPQNWLITTSATVPLSLTSSRLGERERISLMFERQQQQHQHFLPSHYFAYSHHNGNYTKRHTSSLSSSPSSTLDQQAQTTANIKLNPYVVASRDTNTNIDHNHNIHSNGNYRRLNPKKHFPLAEDTYDQIDKESSVTSQSERRMDVSKHFRQDVNRQSQHPYHDNMMMSPDVIESHLSHNPTPVTTKDSFAATNVNIKETPTATTMFSNKVDDDNINEILLPLHAALDTVKQICDFIKDIITDDKDDDSDTDDDADDKDSSNEENSNNDSDTEHVNLSPILTAVKVLLMKTPITDSSYSLPPTEIEGRSEKLNLIEPSTRSLASSKSLNSLSSVAPLSAPEKLLSETATGRARRLRRRKVRLPPIFGHRGRVKRRKAKRKIKKTFKKYMFPLLIAYKLMFLALIPLLVGGLTLLVGSTGMAGFFFALFAAVMTIRRGRGGGGDGGGGDGRASSVNYFL